MKILEKTDEKIMFVEEVEEALANAIRRSSLEIPILAIDEVEFMKNDSVLYDEVLALRMGLTPLITDSGMKFQEKCSCKGKGCAKCTIQMKLKAAGPGIVYSGDIKGNVDVVYKDMPLVSLIEGQELELNATAHLGKGVNHTKYSPGLFYYRNNAELEVTGDCSCINECISACPKNVLSENKGKLVLTDSYSCDLCEACVSACKSNKCDCDLKILPGKEIVFVIESWGQIKAKEIFEGAVDALKENLKEFQ